MSCDRDKSHRKAGSTVSVTRDRTYGRDSTVGKAMVVFLEAC